MYKGRKRPLKLRSRAETEAVALVAETTSRRVFLHLSDASLSNVFDAPNMVIIRSCLFLRQLRLTVKKERIQSYSGVNLSF